MSPDNRPLPNPGVNKFAWILDDARVHFASKISSEEFSERYFAPGSRFLPHDPGELCEYLSSSEFREIQEMRFKLLTR